MGDPLEESGYLEHKPASAELIHALYEEGFIQSNAKEAALDQIIPKPAWQYQCSVFMQMIGIAAIVTGIVLAVLYQWPNLSTQYQLILLMMGILCGIYGAFVFSATKWASQILLLFALGFTGFLSFKLLLLQRPMMVIVAFGLLGIGVVFAIIYRMLPKRWYKI